MKCFTHILYTHGQSPMCVFLQYKWVNTHHAGSKQTFYRPIDIAVLWQREVTVRKEFLTVFMDMLNFTWDGLKARLKCYLDGACGSVRRSTGAILFSCFIQQSYAHWLMTVNCLSIMNELDTEAKPEFNICYWSIGGHPINPLCFLKNWKAKTFLCCFSSRQPLNTSDISFRAT